MNPVPLNIKNVTPTSIGQSRRGQDGIYKHIIDCIGETNKCCVEFGAGNGWGSSNTWYFHHHLKWNRIGFDQNESGEGVHQIHLTKENICEVFRSHNIPKEFDILSVDVDGMDYWLLSAILEEFKPRLINTEICARFQPHDRKVLKYDSNYDYYRAGKGWYGASAYAFKLLGDKHGYTPVLCYADELFLVRSDCLHPDDLNVKWDDIYKPDPTIYDWMNDPVMKEELWMDV